MIRSKSRPGAHAVTGAQMSRSGEPSAGVEVVDEVDSHQGDPVGEILAADFPGGLRQRASA